MLPPDSDLIWRIQRREPLLTRAIFTIYAHHCVDSQGVEAQFSVIDSSPWVHTIAPCVDKHGQECFVMVRQYRHGSESIVLEFPGGVIANSEEPQQAGARELLEESGYSAERYSIIGVTNPNPAMMTNKLYTLLAHNVMLRGQPDPDANERLATELVPCHAVLDLHRQDFCEHALMLCSLLWYERYLATKG